MNEYINREDAVDAGYLSDWYISSVGDEPPVWTNAHIDELLNDFIVIPKDTKVTDIQPVNRGKWRSKKMNREILFRAKSGQTWYYGGVFCRRVYHGAIGCDDYIVRWYIVTKDWDTLQVSPKTICQYTSLADKNGTKIFEGDIVRIGRYFNNNFYTEDNYICKYDTNTASFKFYYIIPRDIADVNKYAVLSDGATLSDMRCGFTIEVLGNIWDNPELITDVEKK